MPIDLNLPPIYDPVILDGGDEDVRAHAIGLARQGAESGRFVWRPSADRIECAVLLRPEEAVEGILPVVLVASLAMLDALGAAGPAAVACDLLWPATLRINGASIGGVALDLAPGDEPEWAVVSAATRKTGARDVEPGERPDVTSLADEGFGEMCDSALLEAFARFLLVWMDRWEEGGMPAIAPHWLQRARSQVDDTVLAIGGDLLAGGIEGLDESGGLVLETSAGPRIIPLEVGLLERNPAEI